MSNIKDYFLMLRPKHWVKNIIIFIPIILSGTFQLDLLPKLFLGFISFSILASAGYILNDIKDIDKDRLHPKKKYRPIPNGSVSIKISFIISLLLIIISFLLSYLISLSSLIIILFYFLLNTFYSNIGKKIRFFDILILSTFYIIRLYYGSIISNVVLTGWFIVTITFIVISLSINKRYMECINSNHDKLPGRDYNSLDKPYLQILMINFSVASIILLNIHAYFVLNITSILFYFLINITSSSILFLYFDENKNKSDDPVERILKNKPLIFIVFIFVGTYLYELLKFK
jgi:decaprenyl-phosphate phosphoribosyltransferase